MDSMHAMLNSAGCCGRPLLAWCMVPRGAATKANRFKGFEHHWEAGRCRLSWASSDLVEYGLAPTSTCWSTSTRLMSQLWSVLLMRVIGMACAMSALNTSLVLVIQRQTGWQEQLPASTASRTHQVTCSQRKRPMYRLAHIFGLGSAQPPL